MTFSKDPKLTPQMLTEGSDFLEMMYISPENYKKINVVAVKINLERRKLVESLKEVDKCCCFMCRRLKVGTKDV